MARIELKQVEKRFGETAVIQPLDLTIEDGAFCVIVGPSGCGKSTLLRLIAGLEEVSAGTITFDNERVEALPPAKRGIAMVFQSYALYPHMTARQNMAFGLIQARVAKAEVAARVAAAARRLQIEPLLERKPGQLSGGQRQRVAIGRAIVREPRVFLFDEPLSNLDASLRGEMRLEIARLHAELGATMVYVTHDQVEAMTLAQVIVVVNGGRVEQAGAPLQLYHRPINRFVASFIGAPVMNFLKVEPVDGGAGGGAVCLPGGATVALPGLTAPKAGSLTLGIRPEHVGLAAAATDAPALVGKVAAVEHLGATTLVHVEIADGGLVAASGPGDVKVNVGERVGLRFDAARAHLFGNDGNSLTGSGG